MVSLIDKTIFSKFIDKLLNRQVKGKGLSENDFTTVEKEKLAALPTNEELSTKLANAGVSDGKDGQILITENGKAVWKDNNSLSLNGGEMNTTDVVKNLNADLLDGYNIGQNNGYIPVLVDFPNSTKLVELGYNSEELVHNNEAYLKGICKWAYNNYHKAMTTIIGSAIPNSAGTLIMNLYGDSGADEDGFPKFCSGIYQQLSDSGVIYVFGFNYWNNTPHWNCRTLNANNINNAIAQLSNKANTSDVYTKTQIDSKNFATQTDVDNIKTSIGTFKYNGTIGSDTIDTALLTGMYIVQDKGSALNSTNIYNALFVLDVASTDQIRQTWYRIDPTTNKLLIQYRLYTKSTKIFGNWIISKIDGANIIDSTITTAKIKDANITNAKLSSASTTPGAGKIPIADDNSMLPVKSIKQLPFTATCTATGWYRIYTNTSVRDNIICKINASGAKEYFIFAIVAGTSGVNITQLSGTNSTTKVITKIRVLNKTTDPYGDIIDIYLENPQSTTIECYGDGKGTFQKPVLVTDIPDGYTATEFETSVGFKPEKSTLFPKTAYNFTNGCYVVTNIKYDKDKVIIIDINGKDSATINIDSRLSIFLNNNGNIYTTLLNLGNPLGKVYTYTNTDNYVCFWFKQSSNFTGYSVIAHSLINDNITGNNNVVSIANAALPASTAVNNLMEVTNIKNVIDSTATVEAANKLITKQLTNEDLDTIKTNEVTSYYAHTGNTCTNKPTGIDGFNLTVYKVTNTYFAQIITGAVNADIYKRICKGGTWTSLEKLMTVNDAANSLLTKKLTNENLNDIKDLNFSSFWADSTNTCTNTPVTKNAFNLQVLRIATSNFITQIVTLQNGIIYKRSCLNNVWNDWVQMATVKDTVEAAKTATTATSANTATTATKLGTTTVGNVNTPIYLSNGTPTAITGIKDGTVLWGGPSKSGSFGVYDAAICSVLGANRFAGFKPEGIKIEYSTNGTTWTDYGATDSAKKMLTLDGSSDSTSFVIGKATSSAPFTLNGPGLRVTMNTKTGQVYTQIQKFILYISTNGSSNVTVTIEKALGETTDYVTVGTYNLGGWSGYNVINLDSQTFYTYGNTASSQYGNIRFTFAQTGNTSTTEKPYAGLQLMKIFAYGGMGWTTPSNLAKTGHVYTFDNAFNVTFPAMITATSFKGNIIGIGKQLTSEDLDTLTGNGDAYNYYYANDNNTCKNKPSKYSYVTSDFPGTVVKAFTLLVFKRSDTNFVTQALFSATNDLYIRSKVTTWSSWKRILDIDDEHNLVMAIANTNARINELAEVIQKYHPDYNPTA